MLVAYEYGLPATLGEHCFVTVNIGNLAPQKNPRLQGVQDGEGFLRPKQALALLGPFPRAPCYMPWQRNHKRKSGYDG